MSIIFILSQAVLAPLVIAPPAHTGQNELLFFYILKTDLQNTFIIKIVQPPITPGNYGDPSP